MNQPREARAARNAQAATKPAYVIRCEGHTIRVPAESALVERGRVMNPNGAILWSGASLIDGSPIVLIATGLEARGKGNSKTGAGMLQTYILRADMDPLEALRTDADASVCGGCVHRGKRNWLKASTGRGYGRDGRTCYVNVGQGPLQAWRQYRAGRYANRSGDLAEVGRGRLIRMGSYGDPAAVPCDVWESLLSQSAGHTGYTHQWRSERLRDATRWCQASCDSLADVARARALGIRSYFRVAAVGSLPQPGETVCPASAEAGKRVTCSQCMMCDASGRGIVIQAHGALKLRVTG